MRFGMIPEPVTKENTSPPALSVAGLCEPAHAPFLLKFIPFKFH